MRTIGVVNVILAAALLLAACGSKTGLPVDELGTDSGTSTDRTATDAASGLDAARTAGDAAGTGDASTDGSAFVVDARVPRLDGSTIGFDGGGDPLGPVAGVAAGAHHTCVWRTTGQVQCWGRNANGQTGSPASVRVTAPRFVPGVAAIEMALGARHTCAVDSDGVVKCWGLNTWGMLGVREPERTHRPTRVSGLPPISRLAGGWSHTCALSVSGEAFCWGKNDAGQIGNGTSLDQFRPVRVEGLESAVDVSVGRAHSCAVTVDGILRCWGANFAGQRGVGGEGNSVRPLTVPGIEPVIRVRAGYESTCVVTRDGRLRCWGRPLGTSPVCISGCRVPWRCDDPSLDAHPIIPFAGSIARLAAGGQHACLVDTGGMLRCWGANDRRQLGLDPTEGCDRSFCAEDEACLVGAPTAVVGDMARVALGLEHSCAVDDSHRVHCWGDNEWAQAGGSGAIVPRPTRVSGL